MKKFKKWFDSAIIKEDESKSASNERHFVLNNGTRKAVFSPSPMNYFDEEEKVWKPIDNSLKKTGDGYVARLGKYTATLSKKDENETVEVKNGDDLISWEYLGNNANLFPGSEKGGSSSAVKRQSNLKVKTKIPDSFDLSSASRAVFADAEGDVDLDYSIEGNGVKENILIKEKSDSYHYYFRLRVAGFEMRTATDGVGLEFYKTGIDPEQAEAQTPEFVMPAPFMYDANGSCCGDVKYGVEKIGDDTYLFSIEASSEWINAEERVFPVCIDPQLLSANNACNTLVLHNHYRWCECEGECCCDESDWVRTSQDYRDHIHLEYIYRSEKTNATLRIRKSELGIDSDRVLSARLIFRQYIGESNSDYEIVRFGNSIYCDHMVGDELSVNITNLYKNASGDFDLEMSLFISGGKREFYLPTIEISYVPLSVEPIRKTLSAGKGVNAEFDVLSGNETVIIDDIEDPVLGVSVAHVFKPNNEFDEYGKDYRLNLDEKMVKTNTSPTGAQYAYTDALGDVHLFDEHLYRINADGEKEYITSGIDSITADADGRLWQNGTEVFRELTTDRGLRASARLENVVNNAEWVEKRVDEEKQVEEQANSYKDVLCNFVSVDRTYGSRSSAVTPGKLTSPELIESFLNDISCHTLLLLTKEEQLGYKSLLTQKRSLAASKTALVLQKESLKDNAKSLLLQYNSPDAFAYQKNACDIQTQALALELQGLLIAKEDFKNNLEHPNGPYSEDEQERIDYYNNQIAAITTGSNQVVSRETLADDNRELVEDQEDQWEAQKALILDQIRGFSGIGTVPSGNGTGNGTLTCQYANVETQINVLDSQILDIDEQINLYIAKSLTYQTQFRTYYKEYLNLNNQLKSLRMQIPVAYLISDDAVKGFNFRGELVFVQDKYGKYIVIERDTYAVTANAVNVKRITSVSDQDGKTMKFLYNGNNKLSEICNSLGERVRFKYDTNGRLNDVERENLPSLTLQYNPSFSNQRISVIQFSDKTNAVLEYYQAGTLKKISTETGVSQIEHDEYTEAVSAMSVSTLNVTYTATETKLTYDKGKAEIYMIDTENECVSAHFALVNGKVSGAEHYEYDENSMLRETEYADESCLNQHLYNAFSANEQIGTVEETVYNTFKEPISVVTSKYAVPRTENDSPTEQTSVEYIYNDDHKLIEKRTTHCYGCCAETNDATVAVEKYFYDNAGEVVRTESYVEGEELKTGVTVEEHFFNEQGVEIRSTTYNSLDPSSKFYTEYEVDDSGKILSAFDETGEHKTAFDYERDGVTVRTKRYPNGSKFSYGRDRDGAAVAITQSTESGEENSTQQVRTLDVVTEVKSGNNTVHYTYDEKRRVKTVSLNRNAEGEDDVYVSYEYSEDPNTHAETVQATLKDGTVTTVTRDAFGNIKKTSCGEREVAYSYNSKQQLTEIVEKENNEAVASVTYNREDNQTTIVSDPGLTETLEYDEQDNRLIGKTIVGTDVDQTYVFHHKETADKSLESISVDGNTVKPETDALGRNVGKTVEFPNHKTLEETVSYVKFGDHATNLPSSIRFGFENVVDSTLQYKYDTMGNIVEISENDMTISRYEYDALGRLTREDNTAFGKTTTWSYDNNGNILVKKEYDVTATPTEELRLLTPTACKLYTYQNNSDQLTSYDGEQFIYDSIGNPGTYRGKDIVWENGRQMTDYDNGNVTFTYDARGRRVEKNSITFTYDSDGNLIKQSDGLEFLYDHTGVFAVKYDNVTYYYRKDAQGNVIALLDNTGTIVVKYAYDAWGKSLTTVLNVDATAIANLNPFRYRGYYLDTETGFYFLKTRYYDPEVGRFITIDDISYLDPESINGLNLYAYCGNNPVMRSDPQGKSWWSSFWSGVGDWFKENGVKLAIGAAFIVVGAVVTALTAGTGAGFMAAFGAALLTSLQAVAISTVISAGIGFVMGGVSSLSWQGALQGLSDGIADGFMWGGIFAGGAQILSGGFKGLAKLGVPTGRNGGLAHSGWLSPDKIKGKSFLDHLKANGQFFRDYGGTILKFGNIHLDVSTKRLLHLAAFGFDHFPIGTVIAGLIGGFK